MVSKIEQGDAGVFVCAAHPRSDFLAHADFSRIAAGGRSPLRSLARPMIMNQKSAV